MLNKKVLDFVNKNIDKTFRNIELGKPCKIIGFRDNDILVKCDGYVDSYNFYNIEKHIEELPKIKIGDIVKIINTGCLYPTYISWFMENKINYDLALRYCYNYNLSVEEAEHNTFTVKKIAKHSENNEDDVLVLIEQNTADFSRCGDVYLIGIEGLEKIEC